MTGPSAGPSAGFSGRRRVQVFAFGGLLLVLMNFSAPDAGMIDLPVSFFLKNLSEPQSQPLAGHKQFGAIRPEGAVGFSLRLERLRPHIAPHDE